jgi:hypothetical protein
MHFEGRLYSGPDEICDLFAKFTLMMPEIWISLLILKNCAFALVHPISLLFYRFLLTGGTFHNVKPIFKKGRRKNTEDYRGVATSSAIPKHFELLLFDGPMYDDLKNLISVNQNEFMKNRSTVTNLLDYFSFVLNSI